jgi:hypothetical protein
VQIVTRHLACWPSGDPRIGLRRAAEWQAKGYEVLVALDADKMCAERPGGPHLLCLASPWEGYYAKNGINSIVKHAFGALGADLVTCNGDDQLPPLQGQEIHTALYFKRFPDGYGVMQCTGDRQGEIINGKTNAERICGSPTFGKGWHARAFGGTGGFPEGFRSYYADELICEVTSRLGLLYQEPALSIEHLHWSWRRSPKQWYHEAAQKNWQQDAHRFEDARRNGFAAYLAWAKCGECAALGKPWGPSMMLCDHCAETRIG